MDILEFAMAKERDAEAFYRALAEKSATDGIRHIFDMLADTETKHCMVLQEMKHTMPTVPEVSTLDDARQALQTLRESRTSQMPTADQQQVDAYVTARGLESEAASFYAEQAGKADDPAAVAIFQKLANQEKMHYLLLDNLVDFVTKPEEWVENAEFSHILDRYRGTDLYPDGL